MSLDQLFWTLTGQCRGTPDCGCYWSANHVSRCQKLHCNHHVDQSVPSIVKEDNKIDGLRGSVDLHSVATKLGEVIRALNTLSEKIK